MIKESFPEAPKGFEEQIMELTHAIQDTYGKYYDDLNPEDQILWNELFRFANIEKDQSVEKKKKLVENLASFLKFLESEYGTKS